MAAPKLDRTLATLLAAIVVLLVAGIVVHVTGPLLGGLLGRASPPVPSASALAGVPARAPAVPSAADDDSPPQTPTSLPAVPRGAPGASALRSGLFQLRQTNLFGRSGTLYVPKQAATTPRPLFVLFHGTGQNGAQIVNAFLSEAEARGVILLAPDSGRSPDGAFNWQVPDQVGETTPDQVHVQSCLAELYAAEGSRIDPAMVFAAGHSGGASSAAYLATNDPRFRGFAVLHGGVFPRGLGTNLVPGWFSTGSADPVRPPAVIERAAAASAPHATTVSTHVYPGGHELTQAEIHDLVTTWLGP